MKKVGSFFLSFVSVFLFLGHIFSNKTNAASEIYEVDYRFENVLIDSSLSNFNFLPIYSMYKARFSKDDKTGVPRPKLKFTVNKFIENLTIREIENVNSGNISDFDSDGVPNFNDNCVSVPGYFFNAGCPVMIEDDCKFKLSKEVFSCGKKSQELFGNLKWIKDQEEWFTPSGSMWIEFLYDSSVIGKTITFTLKLVPPAGYTDTNLDNNVKQLKVKLI